MSIEFTLPELGENVEKGDVVRVLVNAGDVVKKDQPVLELETDKATIEVPSTRRRHGHRRQVKAGDKVKVGQVGARADRRRPAPSRRARAEGRRRRQSRGAGRAGRSAARAASRAAASTPRPAPARRSRRERAAGADRAQPSTSRRGRQAAPAATPRRPRRRTRRQRQPSCRPRRRCAGYARELGVDIARSPAPARAAASARTT